MASNRPLVGSVRAVHLFPYVEERNKGPAVKKGRPECRSRTGRAVNACSSPLTLKSGSRLLGSFYLFFLSATEYGRPAPFAYFDRNTGTYRARAPHCCCCCSPLPVLVASNPVARINNPKQPCGTYCNQSPMMILQFSFHQANKQVVFEKLQDKTVGHLVLTI